MNGCLPKPANDGCPQVAPLAGHTRVRRHQHPTGIRPAPVCARNDRWSTGHHVQSLGPVDAETRQGLFSKEFAPIVHWVQVGCVRYDMRCNHVGALGDECVAAVVLSQAEPTYPIRVCSGLLRICFAELSGLSSPPGMKALTIVEGPAFGLTLQRLCHQLIEDHGDLGNTALIGLQPRGVFFARRLKKELEKITGLANVLYGELDITFHRDDFRHRSVTASPSATELDFSLDDRRVVLIDDVLHTGRSIRAGLDAMLSFGRPSSVQLMVLIDRRFSRELPIQPDFVGKWVDSIDGQRVSVEWKEVDGKDRVLLLVGQEREGSIPPSRSTPTDR